jgi:acyl carrier protein
MDTSLFELKRILVGHLNQVGSVEDIAEDVDLALLGLDSMGAMNLLFELEDSFNVSFDESLLTPEVFKTTSSLHRALLTLI